MAKMNDHKQYLKQRKPVYALILEGRNKTEKLYFGHFNTRNAPYILKLIAAEDTDPLGMAKKAAEICKKFDIRQEDGDKAFCLVDLDLSQTKYEQVLIWMQQILYTFYKMKTYRWIYAYRLRTILLILLNLIHI